MGVKSQLKGFGGKSLERGQMDSEGDEEGGIKNKLKHKVEDG